MTTASELADEIEALLAMCDTPDEIAEGGFHGTAELMRRAPAILSALRDREMMRSTSTFLLDRLYDFEQTVEAESRDDAVRDWHGFVVPAIARARQALPIEKGKGDEGSSRDHALTDCSALDGALDLLPEVKHRLALGQQPNAYGSGRGFVVGIGPVTDCLSLVITESERAADLVEQALRLALSSAKQAAVKVPGTNKNNPAKGGE